jgi:hypothetical protein
MAGKCNARQLKGGGTLEDELKAGEGENSRSLQSSLEHLRGSSIWFLGIDIHVLNFRREIWLDEAHMKFESSCGWSWAPSRASATKSLNGQGPMPNWLAEKRRDENIKETRRNRKTPPWELVHSCPTAHGSKQHAMLDAWDLPLNHSGPLSNHKGLVFGPAARMKFAKELEQDLVPGMRSRLFPIC